MTNVPSWLARVNHTWSQMTIVPFWLAMVNHKSCERRSLGLWGVLFKSTTADDSIRASEMEQRLSVATFRGNEL